jgi:hypothetical protein
MVRTWLILAVFAPAFGGSITYNYTGNTFDVCNGATFLNVNCPANSFSDYDIASLTFSAPLGANLSSASEASSPNLLAWTFSDALGDTPSFSSTDTNAATELQELSLSTNGSGAITGWTMLAETAGFFLTPTTFLPGGTSFYIVSPSFIGGGSGLPEADSLIGNGGNTNGAPGGGWNLSSGVPGTWTETSNSGVPEPSGLVLLSGGLGMIGILPLARRGRQHS